MDNPVEFPTTGRLGAHCYISECPMGILISNQDKPKHAGEIIIIDLETVKATVAWMQAWLKAVDRVPVQLSNRTATLPAQPAGTISRTEYLEIYEIYAKKYGRDQSADRLIERGGFDYNEIITITGAPPKTWKPL